jgi:hypothetical protein
MNTIIEISLHMWSDTMNIDVYMSPKDFGNVAGLCGNFDGDRSNDLEHRDGTISYDNNRSYKFADSWRYVMFRCAVNLNLICITKGNGVLINKHLFYVYLYFMLSLL